MGSGGSFLNTNTAFRSPEALHVEEEYTSQCGWACGASPQRRGMKVERKRSNRGVWIRWNFPGVQKRASFERLLELKLTVQTCCKAHLTSPSSLPLQVASLARRLVEEREGKDFERKGL